ncbi:hypothetical protein BDY19DRAFT_993317 [Irpex rosettiformis]|uniref:Uncharacterized protein n=1 Tax=Irpex rosettiformis TaxID=378272 RepID=A0ACB8U4K5_9APHY|nr:hypothetical protein BDY19DRAFT_993317 [Irpex rosettiformis]
MLVFRSSDDESVFEEFVETLAPHHPPLGFREVSLQETGDAAFTQGFVECCKDLASRQVFGQAFTTVLALSASCQSECGIRGLWYLLPLLASGLVEIRLQFGSNIPFPLLLSFFNMLVAQLEGQTRFARVRLLDLTLNLHSFESGQRLTLSSVILRACSAARFTTFLAIPVDLLSVDWSTLFHTLSCLTELQELSFHPGKLPIASPVAGRTTRTHDKLENLTKLAICASLATCVDVIEALHCPISTLWIECNSICTAADVSTTIRRIESACLLSQERSQQALSPLSPTLNITPAAMNSPFRVISLPAVQWISSLTHLDVRLTGGNPGSAILEAFYPLCSIKVFAISCPFPLTYDEHTITDLLSCWKDVEFLSLNPRPSRGLGLGILPSATVLKDVARCGPHLREFRSCLDGFDLARGPELGYVQTWESLRVLDLGYSIGPMDNNSLDKALDYVARLFPRLDSVSAVAHDSDYEKWPTALAQAFRQRRLFSG